MHQGERSFRPDPSSISEMPCVARGRSPSFARTSLRWVCVPPASALDLRCDQFKPLDPRGSGGGGEAHKCSEVSRRAHPFSALRRLYASAADVTSLFRRRRHGESLTSHQSFDDSSEADVNKFSMGRMGGVGSSAGSYDLVYAYGDAFDGGDNNSFGLAASSRYDNMVTYQTPDFAGVKATVQYSFNEDSVNDKDREGSSAVNRYASAALTGDFGALQTVLAYEFQNYQSFGTDVNPSVEDGGGAPGFAVFRALPFAFINSKLRDSGPRRHPATPAQRDRHA